LIYFSNFDEPPILLDNTNIKEVKKHIDINKEEESLLKKFNSDIYWRNGVFSTNAHAIDYHVIKILKKYRYVKYFIFDSRGEADDIVTINYISNIFKKANKKFIAITSGFTDFFHPHHVVHNNFFKIAQRHRKYSKSETYTVNLRARNKLYCSLNRLLALRHERLTLFYLLQKADLVEDGIISLGSGHNKEEIQSLEKKFVEIFGESFSGTLPILLDGPANTGETPYWDNATASLFPAKEALINIVTESSTTPHCISKLHNNLEYGSSGWSRFFITEKTIKAYFNYQIPLFVAIPGFVQLLRDLDFDLFDDIVNHGYDSLPNIDDRLNFIVQELKRLKESNLLNSVKLDSNSRYNLESRMKKNFNNLSLVEERIHSIYLKRIKAFLNDN